MKKLAVILATITTVIFGVGDKAWSRDNDARDIDTGEIRVPIVMCDLPWRGWKKGRPPEAIT